MLALALLAAVSWADCLPAFPYKGGWLGGDAAYSAPLPDGRTLWLFGDTFVGKPDAADRGSAAMVGNSIGLSTCSAAGFDIEYRWGAGKEPRAFFDTGRPDVRYWPLGAFAHGGAAYVALGRVRTTGTGPFDFRLEGADLARVTPSSAAPSGFEVKTSALLADESVTPAGAVVDGGFAYFFLADAAAGARHRIRLARVPLAELDRPSLDVARAKTIFEPGSSELSVALHGRRWSAVYAQDGLPSSRVVMRTAERLEGPWSAERALISFARREGTFCYAAKEHPELGASPMVVTYACNTFKPAAVLYDLGLYRPEVTLIDP